MDISLLAHLILLLVVITLICWVLSSTFDTLSFLLSCAVTGAIILANPKLLQRVESQCAIQYYAAILIATMLFSVDTCSSDKDLVLLLVVTAGITMISLYAGEKMMLYLSLFLNTYTMTRIGSTLLHKSPW